MNLEAELQQRIASLAHQFYSKGDKTFFTLVNESGYFINHDFVTTIELKREFERDNHLALDWISYSENKRSSGWYVTDFDGSWKVGFIDPLGNNDANDVIFSDKFEAVAFFVKNELEEIRSDISN